MSEDDIVLSRVHVEEVNSVTCCKRAVWFVGGIEQLPEKAISDFYVPFLYRRLFTNEQRIAALFVTQ